MIVWNWQTGQPIRTITRPEWLEAIISSIGSVPQISTPAGHTDKVTSIAFSPDGEMLASGSDDKTIKLWDLQTGQEIVTLYGHSSYVESVAFSPDSKTLVSGGYDKTVKVWQLP
jgi:WD40 repeat protein